MLYFALRTYQSKFSTIKSISIMQNQIDKPHGNPEWLYLNPEDVAPKTEMIYDCWQERELDQAIFRSSEGSASLKDISFPEEFRIGGGVTNYDRAIQFLRWYEQIKDPTHSLTPYLYLFAEPAVSCIENALGCVPKGSRPYNDSIQKFSETLHSYRIKFNPFDESSLPFKPTNRHQVYMYGQVLNFMHAYRSVINPQNQTLSEMLANIKDLVLPILPAGLAQELVTTVELNNTRGFGLHPHAAIWHDAWRDPRFIGGTLQPAFHIGDVPIGEGAGDIDAGAQRIFFSYPSDHTDPQYVDNTFFGRERTQKSPLYYPSNITNLYVIHLPKEILGKKSQDDTPTIAGLKQEDAQTDLKKFLAVVFCDQPTRLDPVTFGEKLDETYGIGSWTIVKETPEGLKAITPRPKNTWHVHSRELKRIQMFPYF